MEVIVAIFFKEYYFQNQNHSLYSKSYPTIFHFYYHFHLSSPELGTSNNSMVEFNDQFYYHLERCRLLKYLSYALTLLSFAFHFEFSQIRNC